MVSVWFKPDEASVAEMPEHAIKHNNPHYVARLDGMAGLLETLVDWRGYQRKQQVNRTHIPRS